jgi:hypothetical protein
MEGTKQLCWQYSNLANALNLQQDDQDAPLLALSLLAALR